MSLANTICQECQRVIVFGQHHQCMMDGEPVKVRIEPDRFIKTDEGEVIGVWRQPSETRKRIKVSPKSVDSATALITVTHGDYQYFVTDQSVYKIISEAWDKKSREQRRELDTLVARDIL